MFIQGVQAAAFCALRDPLRVIKQLFPKSTQHQSLVKAINTDVRDKVSELLPFTLHFNELGKHTLYVAQNHGDAIGFVHVRSELTNWGLVEIAWALDTDLTIRDLRFQRCRIPDCEGEHLTNIIDLTVGKSVTELLQLLGEDGLSLKPELQTKLGGSYALSFSAVQSALKTITVTLLAWRIEVADINRKALIDKYFGYKVDTTLSKLTVSKQNLLELDVIMGGGGSIVDRNSVESFRIDRNGMAIGTIVTASWKDGSYRGMFNWLFDTDKKIVAIQPIPNWPNNHVSTAFEQLLGKTLIDEEQCNTAAQIAGFELYFLSHDEEGEQSP